MEFKEHVFREEIGSASDDVKAAFKTSVSPAGMLCMSPGFGITGYFSARQSEKHASLQSLLTAS